MHYRTYADLVSECLPERRFAELPQLLLHWRTNR